jgi:hypothetical protein
VQSQSLYGIWNDFERTIELKIIPCVGGANIKVWTVSDFSTIEKISRFCGIALMPKRTNWHGFDLISKLEKKDNDTFVNGIVNMPKNKRRTLADFQIVDDNCAHLSFFCREPSQNLETPNKIAFILSLQKKHVEFHLRRESGNIP